MRCNRLVKQAQLSKTTFCRIFFTECFNSSIIVALDVTLFQPIIFTNTVKSNGLRSGLFGDQRSLSIKGEKLREQIYSFFFAHILRKKVIRIMKSKDLQQVVFFKI